jgi:hypothetical protein
MYQALVYGSLNITGRLRFPEDQNLFGQRSPSSNDQIHKKGGPTEENCAMCGHPANDDHIFFNRVLAEFPWSEICSMFG